MTFKYPCLFAIALLPWGCGDDNDQGNNTTHNNNNTGTLCGNGTIEGSEECDDGAANSDSAPDACRTDCRSAHCGDGVTDTGEECDRGAQNADDVPDACRTDCMDPICGDGVVDIQQGELCDLGDDNSSAPNAICRPDCQIRACGDGIWDDETEACDGPVMPAGVTCSIFGYYEGSPSCSDVCSIVPEGCIGRCGDQVVQESEYCDGPAPAFERCQNYGFDAGHLGCSPHCTPGFDQCYRIGWQLLAMSGGGVEGILRAVWGMGTDLFIVVQDEIDWEISILHDDGVQYVTTPVTTTSAVQAKAMWGSAANDVFVVGAYVDINTHALLGGLVLHFDGAAWSESAEVRNLSTAPLKALWGSSGSDVYAVGDAGTILHFDGATWSAVAHGLGSTNLTGISGSAANDVYAVGESGTIWRFDGSAWSVVTHGLDALDLSAVWVSETGRVHAAGFGTAYHFDGSAWSSSTLPSMMTVNAIWGRSDTEIWAVTDSHVLLNNGFHWSLMSAPASMVFMSVWGLQNGHVYVVGSNDSLMLHYRSNACYAHQFPVSGDLPDLPGLWGSAYDDVWAVGRDRILHFDGQNWTSPSPGFVLTSLKGVWGSSSNDVFVAGQNQILHYNGSSWTQPWTGTQNLNGIWGSSTSEVVAVGSVILHYDGALPWTEVALPSGVGLLRAVWGSQSAGYFAVNTLGEIVHTSGGHVWTEMQAPEGWNYLMDVWGSAGDNVFAVGREGRILHYDGVSWQVMYSGTGEFLWSVWGFSGDNVFAAGENGTLIHYNGFEWTPVRTDLSTTISGIWGAPGQALFFTDRYFCNIYANCSNIHRLLFTGPFF